MASHRRQVEDFIKNDLPQSYSSSAISDMCADLERDIQFIKTKHPAVNQKSMEMMLHHKHKKLAFSYPGLFFKVLRGEVDTGMVQALLKLKHDLDEKSISLADARNRVIDSAKRQIEQTRDQPRVEKAKPPGTVVQELSFKCKPEDS